MNLKQLIEEWENKGGQFYLWQQGAVLAGGTSNTIKFGPMGTPMAASVSNGICFQISKKWVEYGFENRLGENRMKAIKSNASVLAMLKGKQPDENGSDETHYQIKNHTCKYNDFKTNKDFKYVCGEASKAKSLSIVGFGKVGVGGHAIAFDVRGKGLYFMDPNLGQGFFKESEEPDSKWLSKWCENYWKADLFAGNKPSYNDLFGKGTTDIAIYT